MAASGHAVGDYRRQQGLDRTEQGEGDCIRQYGDNLFQVQFRKCRQGQAAWHASELRGYGRDRDIQQTRCKSGAGNRDEHAGPVRAKALQADDDRDRCGGKDDRC